MTNVTDNEMYTILLIEWQKVLTGFIVVQLLFFFFSIIQGLDCATTAFSFYTVHTPSLHTHCDGLICNSLFKKMLQCLPWLEFQLSYLYCCKISFNLKKFTVSKLVTGQLFQFHCFIHGEFAACQSANVSTLCEFKTQFKTFLFRWVSSQT